MNVSSNIASSIVRGSTLAAVIFTLSWANWVYAQTPVPPVPYVTPKRLSGVRLQLLAGKPRYPLGEPIEVTMRYTSTGAQTLAVNGVDFDRAGRVSDYGFRGTDTEGRAVRDPAPHLVGQSLGGPRYEAKLTAAKPFDQKVVVNQWLAFDRPGRYFLTAYSTIVHQGNERRQSPPLKLESEPLLIEIAPLDEAQRQLRLDSAQHALQIEDRELDQLNRQTRFAAVQGLRYMLDERAIPLLVRALNDGWINVQSEAELALLAFTDLAPVKAALLRAIDDDSFLIEPRARDSFLRLLYEADRRSLNRNGEGATPAPVGLPYSRRLADKQSRKLLTLPPPTAARLLVEAMQEYQTSRVAVENWQVVLANAAAMPAGSQEVAATLFAQLLSVDEKNPRLNEDALRALHVVMSAVVRDETVNGLLRSACIVGLMRIGDTSFRELLVQEFMALQPKLWKPTEWGHPWLAAQKALGDYKAEEIAQQLLAHFNTPAFAQSGFYPSRSIVFRLSDFAQSLSVNELRGAMQRTLEVVPVGGERMIEALAIKSPDAAVPFIRAMSPTNARKEFDPLRSNAISWVLARLTTPSARALMDELLRSPQESDRVAIVHGFAMSAQEVNERRPSPMSRLAPREELAATYVPELLRLFQDDPSPRVRGSAFYALGTITSIPKWVSSKDTNADDKRYLNQWREWWQQNRARFTP